MVARPKQYFTPEEYIAFERQADYRSEYIDGEIYAMAGGSWEHAAIAGNIYASLHAQLRGKPCRPFNSDLRVRVTRQRYSYADAGIVCGKPQFEDSQSDTLLNPKIVFEVLSPTTEGYDRGEKAEFYRAIPTLTDLLLIAQDRCHVEHYVRQPNAQWLLTEANELEYTLDLASIGCTLALTDIYDGIELGEPLP
jgi:Uma2 family endonuclease